MNLLKSFFTLNKVLDSKSRMILVYSQVVVLMLYWYFAQSVFLPKPMEVFTALSSLWDQGLGQHLITSFKLNLEAIAYSTVISLVLVYLTVIPFFKPIVHLIGKFRFLSMVGLTFVFALTFKGSHAFKLSLLVFSITVFFVTSMMDIVNSIKKEKYDLARTLKMKEWEVTWQVVILGEFHQVFDVMAQNAAIGYVMLTLVEGLSRSEGGIGAVLLNQNKHFHLSAVMAIQIVILLFGLAQDSFIRFLKNLFCPYASLTTVKK